MPAVPKPVSKPKEPKKRQRKTATITCGCGNTFERRADQIGSKCRECLTNQRRERMKVNALTASTKVTLSCEKCGNQFSAFKSKSGSRKFCTNACKYAWQTENQDKTAFNTNRREGEKHPAYKHGKKVGIYKGKEKTRKAVKEIDGDYCLLCGRPGPGLHLHRVIYGSHGGKYVPENCVLLCYEDHGRVHQTGKKPEWERRFLEHIERRRD